MRLRRGQKVKVFVTGPPPYTVISARLLFTVEDTTLDMDNKGVYLTNAIFNNEDIPTIEGIYQGKINPEYLNFDRGKLVHFDEHRGVFTDSIDTIKAASMVNLVGGTIQIVVA